MVTVWWTISFCRRSHAGMILDWMAITRDNLPMPMAELMREKPSGRRSQAGGRERE
jgi:hypothetical protein